jgi:hypothetical protein
MNTYSFGFHLELGFILRAKFPTFAVEELVDVEVDVVVLSVLAFSSGSPSVSAES